MHDSSEYQALSTVVVTNGILLGAVFAARVGLVYTIFTFAKSSLTHHEPASFQGNCSSPTHQPRNSRLHFLLVGVTDRIETLSFVYHFNLRSDKPHHMSTRRHPSISVPA
jgi:hypothetical protein